jgi:pilus assembly protein CpaE
MPAPMKVTLALGPGGVREVAEAFLADERLDHVDELDGYTIVEPQGDVVVAACGVTDEATDAFVAFVSQRAGGRPVVLLAPGGPNGFAGRLVGVGIEDVVVLPDACTPEMARALSGQLVFALHKALAKRTPTGRAGDGRGRLIVTLGLKGGAGKTLTSTNLAVSLADAGHSVAIMDVDLQFGDVALALGLMPETTIYDLVRSGGALDAEKLDAYLLRHPTGVRALAAPVRPDQADVVTTDFLKQVCELLRETFDFVVVDTPPGFTPEVITCVDASTDVCVVGALDALALKNTKLGLETLRLMDYPVEQVKLVLNRADTKVGLTAGDVEQVLGLAPDVLVPSDRDITRSVNEGVPIAVGHRRSEAAKAYHRLAALVAGTPAHAAADDEPKKKARRFAALSRSS